MWSTLITQGKKAFDKIVREGETAKDCNDMAMDCATLISSMFRVGFILA